MIPILFSETATSFTTNGIGRLRCESAYVEKVRNGEYELEFTVPITDKHFADIHEGMYVVATHDNTGNKQPFRIYGREAPMNGLVRFRAHHKSQELSNVIVNPFMATSAPEAIARIKNFCINACPYEFWTDKTTVANFKLEQPASVRSILGGTQGSFLDAFGGGEYEFDGNTVRLWNEMGADNGVTIRYGKNLVDINQEIDALGVYNAIVPFWAGEVDGQHVLVLLDERIVEAEGVTNPVPVVMDMSQDFREQPTQAQLRSAAQSFLATNRPWIPSQNITIDFVQLWQTEEYKQYAPLQRVGLCDTVTVYYKALGITGKAKVIRTRYNVLLDRYDEVELGNPKTSFADTIKTDFDTQIEQAVTSMQGFMDAAIESATELITGGKGGYIYFGYNAQGKPEEMLILDTDSLSTATNIIRINKNGIGFSTNGGTTYRSAWTIDGHFVADFIDTGTLNANIIRAGTITDARGLNFWNLDTGDLRMAASAQIGTSGTTVGDLATQDEVTAAVNTGINNYRQEVNAIVEDLQDQIDGVIDTYYYAYEPTLNNYPADEWTTEALRNEHEGDLFMDTTTGKSYRFLKQNNVWQWVEIPDTAAAQALQVAQQANNLANTKRRVFTSTPYTPYEVGDLWVQGATGDIYKCSTARASGNYTANDWDKASKYTDDTVANQALEAINTMEIGGRNLLHNTNVIDLSKHALRPNINGDNASSGYLSASTGTLTAATHGVKITNQTAIRLGFLFGTNTPSASGTHGLAVGREYTFSCDWETKTLGGSPVATTTYYLRAYLYYATSTSASSMTQHSFATWHAFKASDTSDRGAVVSGHGAFTFTVPDDAVAWNIRIYSANTSTASLYAVGDYLQIENVKLEVGQKGTAWTPAPEDIDSEINGINVYLATLQGQVDGKAETFYQADDPSTNWTAAEKEAHEGDLWYRTGDGVTLRYSGSTWQEQDVPRAVFDEIDGKAQIFVAQPDPPYAIGDLWVQGTDGDIMRCARARADGESYTVSDWVKASKYTDDSALTAFIDGDFQETIDALEGQIDGKAETFYQSADPSTEWDAGEEPNHKGDIWFCTATTGAYAQKTWQWSGSAWQEMKTTPPAEVFDIIDGKAQIFVAQPEPPYNAKDLWVQGSTGDILKCINGRATGSYTASDWALASKYTDDSAIENLEIGGKNKLTGTNTTTALTATGTWADRTWRKAGGGTGTITPTITIDSPDKSLVNGWTIDVTSVSSTAYGQSLCIGQNAVKIIGGQTYTISCYAKGSGKLYMFSGITSYRGGQHDVTSDWQRYSTTFTAGTTSAYVNTNGANVFFGASVAGSSIVICGMQLESGNKATAWNPAPEDFDAKIDTLEAYAESLQGQVDGKAETWYQAQDPALTESWSAEEKPKHKGDIWYETGTGKTYRYSGSIWQQQDVPTEVFDKIDGKAQVFVSQPTPPYAVGDLWVQGSSGDIMKCKTKRTSGNYTASDWEKASKYTDDSAVTTLDSNLTQTEIFNRLTNNGQAQGIYIENGLLYVNATYIKGGILTLGGSNNINGVLKVYNASGDEIGKWDMDGANITGDLQLLKVANYVYSMASIAQVSLKMENDTVTRYGFEIASRYGIDTNPTGRLILSPGSQEFPTGAHTTANDYNILYSKQRLLIQSEASINNIGAWTALEFYDGSIQMLVSNGSTIYRPIRVNYNTNGKPRVLIDADYIILPGIVHTILSSATSGAPNVHNSIGGDGQLVRTSSSSRRYKKEISEDIPEDLNPDKLYDIPVKSFVYKDGYLMSTDQNCGKRVIGFIAEDVAEVYPLACQFDENGRPEMWNYMFMIPGMLKLIQEQKAKIDEFETRIARLESLVNAMREN